MKPIVFELTFVFFTIGVYDSAIAVESSVLELALVEMGWIVGSEVGKATYSFILAKTISLSLIPLFFIRFIDKGFVFVDFKFSISQKAQKVKFAIDPVIFIQTSVFKLDFG